MRFRFLASVLALVLCWGGAANWHVAQGQAAQPTDEDTVFLVAHPQFRDPGWFHTVLIAAPISSGGHIGVILNRPTKDSLTKFFPDHEPSKNVAEPVRYGGPFSPGALVAVIKSETNPGAGSLPLMKDLYIAFRAATIDKVIEQTPNDARYFIGFVGWRAGELKREIDRGLWAVMRADRETVFQKDTTGLWEEMLAQTRRITAGTGGSIPLPPYPPVASFKD